MTLASWHVQGFWVPPAHCSTDRPTGQGLFTSCRLEESLPASSRLVAGKNYRDGQPPLHSWKRGPWGSTKSLLRRSGRPSASFYPSYRGLNFRSARELRWREGRVPQPRRPRARAPEEAGLPAQARAGRRRIPSAAPPSSFPRRSTDPSGERPPAPPHLGSIRAPRSRGDTLPPPGRPPALSPSPSSSQRAQGPGPTAPPSYLDPLLVSPAFRHVGRSARFLLTWSVEGKGAGGGVNLARARRLAARYVTRRWLGAGGGGCCRRRSVLAWVRGLQAGTWPRLPD